MEKRRIARFLARLKTYLFTYKDGFFEFPYLASSPQDMIDGFDLTPGVKHRRDIGYMSTSNLFMDASIIYHQLEEGLWVMLSDANYKSNVNFRRIVDKNYPSDFNVLSLVITEKKIKAPDTMINGIPYSNLSWLLFKPEASDENSFYKGVSQTSVMIFFNESYLRNTLNEDFKFSNSALKGFFDSKEDIILWPENSQMVRDLADPIIEILHAKKNGYPLINSTLQGPIDELFHQFIDTYDSTAVGNKYVALSNERKKKVLKAEKLLMEQIGQPFEGLESLAQKVGSSLSALKTDFKIVFGEPIYQYFRNHQLLYAKQLIIEGNLQINEIAHTIGYQNASKFSAAFKEQIGQLPSEIKLEKEL